MKRKIVICIDYLKIKEDKKVITLNATRKGGGFFRWEIRTLNLRE